MSDGSILTACGVITGTRSGVTVERREVSKTGQIPPKTGGWVAEVTEESDANGAEHETAAAGSATGVVYCAV